MTYYTVDPPFSGQTHGFCGFENVDTGAITTAPCKSALYEDLVKQRNNVTHWDKIRPVLATIALGIVALPLRLLTPLVILHAVGVVIRQLLDDLRTWWRE